MEPPRRHMADTSPAWPSTILTSESMCCGTFGAWRSGWRDHIEATRVPQGTMVVALAARCVAGGAVAS